MIPLQARTVRVLHSNEELQSALERARAFERRDEYPGRLGTHDRFVKLLAEMTHMLPEEEMHTPTAS